MFKKGPIKSSLHAGATLSGEGWRCPRNPQKPAEKLKIFPKILLRPCAEWL